MSQGCKVLFIESSQGGVTGGSLTGLFPLFARLPRSGFSPQLVLHEAKRVIPEIEAFGVPVTIIPRKRVPKEHRLQGKPSYEKAKELPRLAQALRLGRAAVVLARETLPSAVRLAQLARRHRPRVIHLSNGFRTNADGIIAARLSGIPAICHVKAFEKYGAVERWIATLARVGVCMSNAVLKHCEACKVVARDMRVIYDALDPGSFSPKRPSGSLKKDLALEKAWPVVAVVGNIQEWKGQHVAIRAIGALRDQLPGLVCLVIGGVRRRGEAYAQSLRSLVSRGGIEGHVRFLGERADVPDLLAASDLLLHTSVREEPFGRVALEAMAVEKPVVAARGGGMREIVDDGVTGFLYPPGDPSECASALSQLCSNRELMTEMGKRGRQRLESVFGVDRQVRLFGELYLQVTANGARPRPAEAR